MQKVSMTINPNREPRRITCQACGKRRVGYTSEITNWEGKRMIGKFCTKCLLFCDDIWEEVGEVGESPIDVLRGKKK